MTDTMHWRLRPSVTSYNGHITAIQRRGNGPEWEITFAHGHTHAQAQALVDYHNANIDALNAENVRLHAENVRLREALKNLLTLNDNYGHFGGEIYQDKIDRAWDKARAALVANGIADAIKKARDAT
jgi:hypothetical protein